MSRILVVDDKDENVYYLEVLLRGHGHVVDTARHGAEALTVARRTRPDLVVSDLLMPVMDGYTLLRRWKADPSLAPIPFIVYTATYTEAADEQLALDLGADAFILKPAEPEDFVARVDEVVRRAEVRRPVAGGDSAGAGEPAAPTEDPALLKTYSETLIRKLEEKTFQLEEANEALRQDIAERQRVEAALREREAEIRTLIESLPQLVWIAGPDGRTIDVNQQWLDMTGLERDECIQRGWELALHPDDYETSSQRWDAAMRTSAPYQEEYRLRAADGSYRWMLSRAVALRDEHGTVLRWFGTCTDIDDLKRAEANLLRTQRLESIGTLAGGIAHDLNNLLSPILVGSELLRLQHDEPTTVELLDTIDTSARRGADLVRQVLAFARGFGGERVTVDLRDVVDEVMAIVSSTFPKSIEVVVEVSDGLPTVLGDPTQLHQVLLNLCVNARDAMPDGGTLTIRVTGPVSGRAVARFDGDRAVDADFVVLEVTDDGVGIPADMIDRIFEPFLTTKATGGSGLGLSTVLGIVRGHGGGIDVRSTPGAGSTFEVSLPVGQADGPAAAGAPIESGSGRSRLVLVVDDESAVRETIRQVLEAAGFRVALAVDGAEALAMFSSRRADVSAVLTDVMMPGLDGADLVDAIRLLDASQPVVVMSGAAAPDVERRLAELDGVSWVSKPFTSAELLSALYRLVG